MKNVILCGGSGTRLWPLSRKLMPKQFLKLFNNESLFQKTLKRNEEISDEVIIISNMDHYFIALDQLEELHLKKFRIDNTNFLLEEIGRNTAAATAFAALESDEDEILFITPSDHLIKDEKQYHKAINRARELAKNGYLVTFGIVPTSPNIGYGYIEVNGENAVKFHEKPDLKTAQKYLNKGNFLWNSGMFMFKASLYLEELKKQSPTIYEEVLKSHKKRQIVNKKQIRLKEMQDIPNISIDYAIMEKSSKIKTIKSDFEWNDVGSFDSLINEINTQEIIEIEGSNNFYYSDNGKVVATIGLENFIIVDTKDALLISKKGEAQKVKNIINTLKENSAYDSKLLTHNLVSRPWGTYEVLVESKGYKIKKIVVKPNKRLSLQKHFNRNEHWTVVSGTAEVTVGDKIFLLRPNESTYIKMGEPHRLANPGKIPVVLVEIQVGEYTGEDDIIRIEDDFKRGSK